MHIQSKEEGGDQESIKSIPQLAKDTIWESDKNTRKHHIQESPNLVKFYHENRTSIKGHTSVIIVRKMRSINRNLHLVNINAHTKFGQNILISSQDTERKRNSEQKFYISQGS